MLTPEEQAELFERLKYTHETCRKQIEIGLLEFQIAALPSIGLAVGAELANGLCADKSLGLLLARLGFAFAAGIAIVGASRLEREASRFAMCREVARLLEAECGIEQVVESGSLGLRALRWIVYGLPGNGMRYAASSLGVIGAMFVYLGVTVK